VRRRQPPSPPPADGLSDEQAAALEREVARPGWRMDGPEFDGLEDAAVRLLAARWRRRVERDESPLPHRPP
jgi:hypothetical protein